MESGLNQPVAIIGGGPVGLYTVFSNGLLGIPSVLIESEASLGGQCTVFYPNKPIYDVPAYPEIKAQDLIEVLIRQMQVFKPKLLLGKKALAYENKGDHLNLQVSATNRPSETLDLAVTAVIVAIGNGSFVPKKPPIENIATFEQLGAVVYTMHHLQHMAGKRVVVLGGGDSALDWVFALVELGCLVTLVHRRATLSAHEHSQQQLLNLVKQQRVEFATPYQASALVGKDSLEGLVVKSDELGERLIPADFVVPCFGVSPNTDFLNDWGVNRNQQRIITHPLTGETNIPRVYAVGDCVDYEHKRRLIANGFFESNQASWHIYNNYYQGNKVHQHSTTHFETLLKQQKV